MPHILAYKEPHPAETGVKGPEVLSSREIALLIKEAVGGQIHFSVGVAQLPALKVKGGIEKAIIGRCFHKAHHNGNVTGKFPEDIDFRRIMPQRHIRDQVLEEVSRQRQLRKDDKISLPVDAPFHGLTDHEAVIGDTAEFRFDLCQSNSEIHDISPVRFGLRYHRDGEGFNGNSGSVGKLKGVGDMLYTGSIGGKEGNCDDIEPGAFAKSAIAGEPRKGRFGYLPLLEGSNCQLGDAVAGRSPGFDLDEHESRAVTGYDVNLPSPAAEVPVDDPVIEPFKVGCGQVLSADTEQPVMMTAFPYGHRLSPRCSLTPRKVVR